MRVTRFRPHFRVCAGAFAGVCAGALAGGVGTAGENRRASARGRFPSCGRGGPGTETRCDKRQRCPSSAEWRAGGGSGACRPSASHLLVTSWSRLQNWGASARPGGTAFGAWVPSPFPPLSFLLLFFLILNLLMNAGHGADHRDRFHPCDSVVRRARTSHIIAHRESGAWSGDPSVARAGSVGQASPRSPMPSSVPGVPRRR